MTQVTNKATPRLRKASRPPLSRPRATPAGQEATACPPAAADSELNPGGPRRGLGRLRGARANGEDAVVKWDDDGRTRLRQPWLKKV
jgi:hypothetical protein